MPAAHFNPREREQTILYVQFTTVSDVSGSMDSIAFVALTKEKVSSGGEEMHAGPLNSFAGRKVRLSTEESTSLGKSILHTMQ